MDINKNISETVGKAMKERKISAPKLAELLHLDLFKLNNYRANKAKWDMQYLYSLAGFFGKTIDELIGASRVNITKLQNTLVPVLGFADCGKPASTWYDSGNKFVDAGDVTGLRTPFILLARGDSMRPYIVPGDKLLCADIEFSKIKDRTAVVVVYKGSPDTTEANAKLILKKKDHIILYSVNTMFAPEEIYEDDIIKIYKLIKIIREVK